MFVYFVLLITTVNIVNLLSSNFYMLKPAFIKVDNKVLRKLFDSFLRVVNDSALKIVGACKSCVRKPAAGIEPPAYTKEEDEEDVAKYPKVGRHAPNFSGTAVVDREFKQIKLKDYKGKYLVLFFYTLDFTFAVCPSEVIAFSEAFPQFKRLNCEVVAASTDSHFQHIAWMNMPRKEGGLGDMNIALLGDKSAKVARAYGVYDSRTGVAARGLFIIDDRQRLRHITVNDVQVGRSVEETLRLVQAFQHSDRHGDGCPANWRPGHPAVKQLPATMSTVT